MKHTFLIFALLLLLSGCSKLFNEHRDMPNMQWEANQPVNFVFKTDKAGIKGDVYIAIRHTSAMQFGDINVKLTRTSPSGKVQENRFTLAVRDPKSGQSLGEAMGDIVDIEVLVQQGLVFEEAGEYKFSLEQFMEQGTIPSVMEVGLVIKKSTAN